MLFISLRMRLRVFHSRHGSTIKLDFSWLSNRNLAACRRGLLHVATRINALGPDENLAVAKAFLPRGCAFVATGPRTIAAQASSTTVVAGFGVGRHTPGPGREVLGKTRQPLAGQGRGGLWTWARQIYALTSMFLRPGYVPCRCCEALGEKRREIWQAATKPSKSALLDLTFGLPGLSA